MSSFVLKGRLRRYTTWSLSVLVLKGIPAALQDFFLVHTRRRRARAKCGRGRHEIPSSVCRGVIPCTYYKIKQSA